MQKTAHSNDAADVRLGGIKMSPELVLFSLHLPPAESSQNPCLLQSIAEKRINLTFLIRRWSDSGSACSFCVAKKDAERLERLMGRQGNACGQVERVGSVASLSIFPHNYSPAVLGTTVKVLGEAGITIHSFCTSPSSLVVIIDFHRQTAAVEALQKVFSLPANHAPFYPDSESESDPY